MEMFHCKICNSTDIYRSGNLYYCGNCGESYRLKTPENTQTSDGNKKVTEMQGDFEIKGNKLIKYHGSEAELIIPDGITEIGEAAFMGNESLEKVIIPQGVILIGNGAFSCCKNLKSVTFPDTLWRIDECAFYMCMLQGELILPDSVSRVEHMAFRGNEFTEIRAKGLINISSCAFFNCYYLTKLSFGERLTTIGASAF